MTSALTKPKNLKRQVKSAVLEILDEQPALLREALEDLGLGRAIQRGLRTPVVSREQVFARLRDRQA
jgi:hypothetical protein